MIRKGQVQVNQETAARPEVKIDEQNDKVLVNGQTIGYAAFEYYMLHKPAGVVSATEDKRDKTVIDLMGDLGLLGDMPESNQLSLFDFA